MGVILRFIFLVAPFCIAVALQLINILMNKESLHKIAFTFLLDFKEKVLVD